MNKIQGSIEKRIAEIATPVIEMKDAILIDVTVRGSQYGRTIEIFIDNDSGITTDLCASVSREVGKRLDAERIVQGRYYLVVSSPGTDRPLFFLRQYKKHIDRYMSVKFREGVNSRTVIGKLTNITDSSISLEEETGAMSVIQFDSITEAKVLTAL
jgi:ribosome maturation factor RimP